ncbi:class I SAM-dependent methyltransferase [Tenacibaculum sp. UWU-22]|uniref:class I SAM-dependent methyltransferase n=1 Tax=Tenacibaculum sp. UWU-22 TaxID=3234187 RepID=UPI0034DB74A0
MGKKFNFFKEAVKNYKTLGTVVPSSRYLAERMLKSIDFSNEIVIVELGPGNGAITHKILKNLSPKSTLICFEINDVFYNELVKIKNEQLIVLKASAEKITTELQKLGIAKTNYVISSLPLTILPKELSTTILEQCYKSLKADGLFIQYQYNLSYYRRLKSVFKTVLLDFEPLNFPPAFVYRCKKQTD